MAWGLLTSLPVTAFPRACTVVQWYRGRWAMERFFRVLTQGGQLAQWRLQTEPRGRNALASDGILAWRIHPMTMASRAYPAVSGEVVFEPPEWHTLETMQQHGHPPPTPPPLRELGRSRAQLGGCFARKGDGAPGITVIWQGSQRLHAFI